MMPFEVQLIKSVRCMCMCTGMTGTDYMPYPPMQYPDYAYAEHHARSWSSMRYPPHAASYNYYMNNPSSLACKRTNAC